MAEFYGQNYYVVYEKDPAEQAKKGEIAGRERNMFDRYEMGAEASGDLIYVGGKIPQNVAVVDAWISVSAGLSAGCTLSLSLVNGVTEDDGEANPSVPLASQVIIPATAMDAGGDLFVRLGRVGVDDFISDAVGTRLGTPPGEIGTRVVVTVGGAANAAAVELKVLVMYYGD